MLQWSTIRRLTEEVMQRMRSRLPVAKRPSARFLAAISKSGDRSLGLCRQPDFVARRAKRGVDIEAKQQIYRIVRELAAKEKAWCLSPVKWRSCRWCVPHPVITARYVLAGVSLAGQWDELMSAILSVH